MDGSSSSNVKRRNGKRPASESLVDNVRERKRGVGIAKLEQMRVEEEMMKQNYYPFRGAHTSGPGIGIQAGMVSYGTSGNMSGLYIPPFARPPSASGAASHVNRSNEGPSRTLQLFPYHMGDEHESVGSKREGDDSLSVEPTCKNPSDQEDLDLKL